MNDQPDPIAEETANSIRSAFKATGMSPELAKQIIRLCGVQPRKVACRSRRLPHGALLQWSRG